MVIKALEEYVINFTSNKKHYVNFAIFVKNATSVDAFKSCVKQHNPVKPMPLLSLRVSIKKFFSLATGGRTASF